MHLDLAGGPQALRRLQHISLAVQSQQLVRGDEALAHARGGGKDGAVLQQGGDVAVVGGHPAQLPHFVAHVADLLLDGGEVHLCSAPFRKLQNLSLSIAFFWANGKMDFCDFPCREVHTPGEKFFLTFSPEGLKTILKWCILVLGTQKL